MFISTRVAILAALNLAEEFLQLEHNYKELVKMVEEIIHKKFLV